jgi:hypothetical protein
MLHFEELGGGKQRHGVALMDKGHEVEGERETAGPKVRGGRLPDRGLMTVIGLRKELLGRDGEGAADEEEETDRDGGSGGGDEGRGEQKTPTRNKLFATYSRALQCCFIIFFTLPATTNPGSLLHRASLCFTVAIVCLGLHVDFP